VRRTEDTEKRVKNVKLAVNAEANRQVFGHIVQAFDESMARKSTERPTTICRPIARTAITTLAAAAVILIAITLVIGYRNRDRQVQPPRVVGTAKSPGEMLTVLSLNMAYRRGGMQAVEKQYEKAFKILGPRLTSISVKDLLAESNINRKGQYYEKD
jgi:hypothetical protein